MLNRARFYRVVAAAAYGALIGVARGDLRYAVARHEPRGFGRLWRESLSWAWRNDGTVEPEIAGSIICEPCADAPAGDDDPHPRDVAGWVFGRAPVGAECGCCGRVLR